jgi:superfamily II DNA/RNA helicase
MTPQQRVEHDELNDPIARLVSASKRRPLTQAEFLRLMSLLTKQRIISNGLGQLRFDELWPAYRHAQPDTALIDGLFAPKLVELRRLVEDLVIEQRRKVVVFSQWRRMLRLAEWSVRDVLERAGARPVFFTGAERPAQRTRSIVDFHDDPHVPMMFLSDAGGVGLNLQRAANACINLELPWNPAVLEQRIGRIYRLGQKDPIDVYHFVSEYGIESRIANLVGTKRALFAGLFDGTSDQIQFQGGASFLSSVEKLVQIDDLPEPPESADAENPEDAEEPEDAPEAARAESALADELPRLEGPTAPPGPKRADSNGSPSRQEDPTAATQLSPAALFDSLRMERTPDGGLRIDAPPGAAEQLVELFSGMARLLGATAGRSKTSGEAR